nr:tRNA (adenine(37)-N6)-methyltransferase-like [Procambarus clarkii]
MWPFAIDVPNSRTIIMTNTVDLSRQLTQARNELNNLRKRMQGLQAQHRKDISHLEKLLTRGQPLKGDLVQKSGCQPSYGGDTKSNRFSTWKPIGHIISWFRTKNGTPRQGSVSTLSRGILKVDRSVFNNPHHALEGLHEYSHVWIFFVFDQNDEKALGHSKTKVAPPRLNGERVGVFATRSPHRPNPLGLTLARLERVQDDSLYLSGIDILDGTPVLDIKPYIPQYDAPQPISSTLDNLTSQERRTDGKECRLLENKKTVNMTEIIVKENSYCSVTISGGCNEPKVKQSAPSYRPICLEECSSGKKSKGHNKTNVTVFDSKIISPHFPKQCDTDALQVINKESGKDDQVSNSGSLIVSGTNFGRALLSCDKGDFMSCRIKENAVSRLSKGNKLQPVSGNKHTNIQNHRAGCKQLDSSGEAERAEEVITASWLEAPPSAALRVIFNPIAEAQVKRFSQSAEDCYRLEFLGDDAELTAAISSVLSEDPRSAYRRQKCSSLLYYFNVDTAHITAWFEGNTAEVLRVHPLQESIQMTSRETVYMGTVK